MFKFWPSFLINCRYESVVDWTLFVYPHLWALSNLLEKLVLFLINFRELVIEIDNGLHDIVLVALLIKQRDLFLFFRGDLLNLTIFEL